MKQGQKMPPRLGKPGEKAKKLNVIVTEGLAEKIDNWRIRQPGIPNVSEAIRQLVELGLKAPQTNGDKAKPKKRG
jgi:hypothetical protein